MSKNVEATLSRYLYRRERLIDMLIAIQETEGYISDSFVTMLASGLNMSPLDVRETLSFYHFLHDSPSGKHTIYLADTVIARMKGYDDVKLALEESVGCQFGEVTEDGLIGLYDTQCIGLSDQEPAMLVDGIPFTHLTPEKVRTLIAAFKSGVHPKALVNPNGYAEDSRDYIESLVDSNIRQPGPIFFGEPVNIDQIIRDAVTLLPMEVIDATSTSKLRGRGGAGFSSGLKWRLCHDAPGDTKYVICNADEGEPGTFKDRVILTQSPEQVFAGMIIAGHAIGAREGILYLRYEYRYLVHYLESTLASMRVRGLLGASVGGNPDFHFDIRIQLGAGAYICGDESALIESCEGKRGTPRVKPPFPVHQGFKGCPTAVNNVETLANVTRILEQGARWYEAMETTESAGTRLISVSGDVDRPGIYEIEWGISLTDVLELVGAQNPRVAQISGLSGECVSAAREGNRTFSYKDLSCNGSLMVFNYERNLLEIVRHFIHFFVEESCGICTPCRAGNVELYNKVSLIIEGRAVEQDLDEIFAWAKIIRGASRCGLGTTSPKPILTSMNAFPEEYKQKLVEQQGSLLASFDLNAALHDFTAATEYFQSVDTVDISEV
ncbi:NAD(P)H-dependent oxidoreductase subunit E [Enterovibrio nigricans]|uniref:NADH-quinone oxidoreductase subunit F n=1 Tax=Enterovibrio nigricans DSM 22720 TaxID=1121868 RepID=A0A1T4UYK1_9GAMM|nr:NAD(P)H-dependent oxidoreductase subunit E [Enterovibrio nigricans]SKA57813.1 NAD(P)-dependent nickel-iron dehydrogenase flavin-containing subunit [Enterovibrio nigricans DSM 22720]